MVLHRSERSRVIIDNGGQRIILESGGEFATHSDKISIPRESAHWVGISWVGRGFLLVLATCVWIFNQVFWGLMGILVGSFWALLRKRK